jgi:hypothetical protein
MNCEQAQEEILLADDPAALLAAGSHSESGRHAMECAVCRAFTERLVRLEGAVAGLPMPVGSEDARQAVLAGVRSKTLAPRRQMFLRPAWISAVAAVLVIGIGVAMWLKPVPAPTPQSPVVMDQLIDWDLALADAEAPQERAALYASQAATLQTAVQQASLNDEDRQFATTLLENGAWLSDHHDPVERTEKFCDLADLLMGRMDKAAAANDASAVQRLGKHYGRVQKGIGANLARLDANAFVAPPGNSAKRLERLERIAKRQEEAQRRLAVLAERSPKAAQKALQRMMEKKAVRRGATTENSAR